jgi:omega-6 fatty acid desaturase (delta-12 desaturase)
VQWHDHRMQSNPRRIDALSRSSQLRLRDLSETIPKQCFEIQAVRAWTTLLRVLCCFGLASGGLVAVPLDAGAALAWQLPLHGLLWVLSGLSLLGLFVIGHDCGHRAFSKRAWVNRLVGHLCHSPLANAFQTWVVTHDHHHSQTQRRGQEVDWASHLKTEEELEQTTWHSEPVVRLGYALPFGIFFWIVWNTIRRGLLVRWQIGEDKWARERGRLLVSNLCMVLAMVGVYGGLLTTVGLWMTLELYAIPAVIANIFGALIITVQHANRHTLLYTAEGWSPLRGQLVSTFDVRFPRWMEWMWCDINIHIPHHIAPKIPWYHLREASQAIRAQWPEYYQSERFGLHHLSWFAKTPVLKEDTDLGIFELEMASK